MRIHKVRSKQEYLEYRSKLSAYFEESERWVQGLLEAGQPGGVISVPGFSVVAEQLVDFEVKVIQRGGKTSSPFRESIVCPKTQLNNRLRAVAYLLSAHLGVFPDESIYIGEQVTPFYRYLQTLYPSIVGSEFLGLDWKGGQKNDRGVRHEDLEKLSFADQSFNLTILLDILEHVVDFKKVFAEVYRCLRPGGKLLWSAPFVAGESHHVVRAEIVNDELIHHMEPEYHGDPIGGKGVLCYRYFGWNVIADMIEVGFEDAYAALLHSNRMGHFGPPQPYFIAEKAA